MVVEVRKHKEIIAELRLVGLDLAADRLSYLESLAGDDPDEPPILLESLRHLALFLVGERRLGNPQIGVSPDGLAGAQWRAENDDVVAMEFLADGLIRFRGDFPLPRNAMSRGKESAGFWASVRLSKLSSRSCPGPHPIER